MYGENPSFSQEHSQQHFFLNSQSDDLQNSLATSQTSFYFPQSEYSHTVWENRYTEQPNEGLDDPTEEFTKCNLISKDFLEYKTKNEYSENYKNLFVPTLEETNSQEVVTLAQGAEPAFVEIEEKTPFFSLNGSEIESLFGLNPSNEDKNIQSTQQQILTVPKVSKEENSSIFTSKKRGRIPKSNENNRDKKSNENRKTKSHKENIMIKIKTKFFESTYKYLNGITRAQGIDPIVKLNKAITGQIEMKSLKHYLFCGKTVGDLFLTERINDKTLKIDENHNRKVIHQIYKGGSSKAIYFLNTRIYDLYKIFIEKNKAHNFQGFNTLTFYYEKFKEEDLEYAEIFKSEAEGGFIEYYKKGRGRAHRKAKNSL